MKYEIIYTEEYALIVSDVEIKDVMPFIGKYHLEKGQIINQFPNYLTDLCDCQLIIAHRPLTDAPILGWIPVLPAFSFSQQDDVKQLSLEMGLEFYVGGNYDFENGVRKGYNKAKETYKYTEEDLRKSMTMYQELFTKGVVHSEEQVIASIQQPKRPKYFTIKSTKMNLDEIREQGKGFLNANTDKSVTINSQGQTELIGDYEQ
jgi:hypothetical protein